MGGLAGIVRWGGGLVKEYEIKHMLKRIHHRAPDGSKMGFSPGVGFGHANLALSSRDSLNDGIVWNHDKTVGLVADARIYNREALFVELDLDEKCCDARLILSGYLHWGKSVLDKLEGDFSFAVFDMVEDKLFAARDIIGAKPFFYSSFCDRLVFGSEPKQILGFSFGVPPHPDRLEVARYLDNQLYAGERTVWKSIKRLKPGCFLLATKNGVFQEPYWKPDFSIQPTNTEYEENIEAIKARFVEAVSRRIEIDSTSAIHVSGGYDSSSIAIVAEELTKDKADGSLASLIGLSVTYDEEEVDESEFIQAVKERLSYPVHIYSAPKINDNMDLAAQVWQLDSPAANIEVFRDIKGINIMKDNGARVLIMGLGGDDVFWEPDYGADLLKRGEIVRFLTWCFDGGRRSSYSYVKGMLRGYLVKNCFPIYKAYRWLAGRIRVSSELKILSAETEALLASQANDNPVVTGKFDSYAQKQLFEWMTCSRLQWNVEHLEAFYAQYGLEVRHPFLDKALMERVLSVPFTVRSKNSGRMKPLLQDVMGEKLPELVRSRNNKATFDRYFLNMLISWIGNQKNLVRLCDDSEVKRYFSKGYCEMIVEKKGVSEPEPRRWGQAYPIWAMATLEAWGKSYKRY